MEKICHWFNVTQKIPKWVLIVGCIARRIYVGGKSVRDWYTLVYARARPKASRKCPRARAYKSRDYRREICLPAELNAAVSRVANRGAKSRSSRHRPPHDTRICQLDAKLSLRDTELF